MKKERNERGSIKEDVDRGHGGEATMENTHLGSVDEMLTLQFLCRDNQVLLDVANGFAERQAVPRDDRGRVNLVLHQVVCALQKR